MHISDPKVIKTRLSRDMTVKLHLSLQFLKKSLIVNSGSFNNKPLEINDHEEETQMDSS